MADISMCPGGSCPSRFTCYRFLATPSLFNQCWIDFDVNRNLCEDTECDDYIECDSKDFERKEK